MSVYKNTKLQYVLYTVSQNSRPPLLEACLIQIAVHRFQHYLSITYSHTHYDVCTLPCVLSVTSLCLSALQYVQCIVIDKGIKQQRTLSN